MNIIRRKDNPDLFDGLIVSNRNTMGNLPETTYTGKPNEDQMELANLSSYKDSVRRAYEAMRQYELMISKLDSMIK